MLRVAFDPIYIHPLPENHRFPMEKYDLLPKQLLYEGTLSEANFIKPGEATVEDVLRVHDPEYFRRLKNLELSPREQRVSGFIHSDTLIRRELTIAEGTRLLAELALEGGVGMNIAGGTHHAFTDRAEGFCLLNDQAIAARWLLEHTNVRSVLIVDLDVHQGNGTAQIFESDPRVFTFSMHGSNNYPLHKMRSDLDVALPDNCGDHDYHYLLEKNLATALERSAPDFVFYQCGVDVLATDKLGRLGLSMEGCRQRDRILLEAVKQSAVPLVCSMGGGYSKEIRHIVEAHANTFRLVQQLFF